VRLLLNLSLLLLSIIAFAEPSTAKGLAIVRDLDKQLILEAQDCLSLDKEVTALRHWTLILGEPLGLKPQLTQQESGRCQAKINGSVPAFVTKYHGESVPHDGPNCFNAVLVFNKIVPEFRVTTDEEVEYWLHSPLCQELSPGEERRPNDIGLIYGQVAGNIPHHAEIYISDDLCFEKIGTAKENGYQLTECRTFIDSHLAVEDGELKKIETVVPVPWVKGLNPPEKIRRWARYFRCKSLDSFLKETSHEVSDRYSELESRVCQATCGLGSLASKSALPNSNILRLIKDILPVLEIEAQQELKRAEIYNSDDKIKAQTLIRGLLLRIGAIKSQIEISIKENSGKGFWD